MGTINWWILLGCITIILLIVGSVFLIHPCCCGKKKKEKMLDIEKTLGIVNGTMKRDKSAFTRDYGAQLSLSNEMRSKTTCRAIKEKINGLHSMKKTNLVAKVIQLESQLDVYSSNGFVSIKDVKELAKGKSDEENKKLREKLDNLEEHNALLRSRFSIIEELLKEKDKNKPILRPEEVSGKSSSSSLSTVINVSSQSSSSDFYTKSLNRSIGEVEVRNSTLDCTSPVHFSSGSGINIQRGGTQEEEKIPITKDIFKKTLQNFSNVFSRKSSKKDFKAFIDKPVNTKLLSESEKIANNKNEDEKREDNAKTSTIEDVKEEDKKNPFLEGERIEDNTKTSIIENSQEEDNNNPFFKNEKVEDNTEINDDLRDNKNPFFENDVHSSKTEDKIDRFVNSVPDFNSNVLQMLVSDHDKLTNPFWTDDIKDENDNYPPEKTETDFRNREQGKEESCSSNLKEEPDVTVSKKSLCQSISLDISPDEEDEKYNYDENVDHETISIKSEPVT